MVECAKVDVIAASTQRALVWPQLVAHLFFCDFSLAMWSVMVMKFQEWAFKNQKPDLLKI